MRVLFNGAAALAPKTGVGHTTANLHRALAAAFPRDEFWLYPGDRLGRIASRLFPHRPGLSGPARPSRLRRCALWAARTAYAGHFHAAVRLGRFDLYHEPNFLPFRTPLPTVVTVHDLSVVLFPQWHPPERVRRYEREFARGLAAASHVLVVSETIRGEAVRVLGLAPNRVTAVRWGIGPEFRPHSPAELAAARQRLSLPPRYLLYVGTIEPRKNLATLLRAFCELPAGLRESCPLLLGGAWGWRSEPERELFEGTARHRGVRHLGYVADEDLPALYAGAVALFYPSFYEGFGLPPVEMMACAGAAVVSSADAVREVVGTAALVLDPHDLPAWRDAMRLAITDREYLDPSRRRGPAHAATFTWEDAARRTFAVYQSVLGVRPALLESTRKAA